ncbi:NUDIX hydrolase [Amycolatopsis sp. OK19-0408]|uniref:NUDIX hydrolase n=1 Tax=Amycolatopsis iheyensis TaxID=2945988 RepID=A0A9X2SRB9_9PSEU|nr:NUDIX hydrolase [Amycolatopsis iheyensis]MCR6489835.1 NUDIX hydrolase [Amycolatopsis iheyensis]
MTQAPQLSPAEHYARRGKMIAGAGLIIRDQHARVLLVHTTYGAKLWELPGGGLEPGEFPPAGAEREVTEEIGLDVKAGNLLVADLVPYTLPDGQPALLTNWLFDGGIVEPDQIRPDLAEVDEARFCTPADCHELLPPHMARRIDHCLEALRTRQPLYLHHGYLPTS